MPRPLALVGAFALAATLLVSPGVARAESTTVVATAEIQNPDASPNIAPGPVKPDVAYETPQGGRVELYTSLGDNNGGIDWRPVNEFAYLLNSVPQGKQIYATIYNTLWDGDKAKYNKIDDKWEIWDSTGKVKRGEDTFGPTQALLYQLNQYTKADRSKYIHLLLSRKSMRDALKAGSGLADLIYKAGDKDKDGTANLYKECKTGNGACLIAKDVDEEALMHAKYALFEQTLDSEGRLWDNVVWITSANLNGASGGKKSNTSIVLYGETDGYNELLNKVWKAEVSEKFTAAYGEAISGITGTNSDFTFFPSPRLKSATDKNPPDFEQQFLKSKTNAELSKAKPNATKESCKAYLVHSLFSESRSGVLDQLATLQSEGCTVKIVLGENAIGAIVTTYFSMSSKVRALIDRTEFSNVHDKTLTLTYKLKGSSTTYGTVWGGSENLNGTSLRYDELSFRADDLTLARAVEQHSERLYQLSRGGEANKPVTKITVVPAKPQINVDQKVQLRTRISPSDATLTQVTWKSDNTAIATVNAATGEVTAISPGQAKITASSVSSFDKNGKRIVGSTTVDVWQDSATPPSDPGASAFVVSAPPTLTMAAPSGQPYQSPGQATTVKITWGQGDKDITGKVTLQYYSAGKWKNYKTVTVKNGVVTKSYVFKSTKTWRLRADSVSSPGKASITSAGKYSDGYRYLIVRSLGAKTTPKIYAPTLIKGVGSTLPIVVSWKGAATGRSIQVQYKSGTKWISLEENKFSMSTNNKIVGAKAPKSTYWRVLAREKGKTTKVSNTINVKVVS